MMKRLLLTAVAASLLSSAFLISVPAAQAEEAAYKLVLLRHPVFSNDLVVNLI